MKSIKITNLNIYSKFIGILLKKGKKTKAKRILSYTFLKICFFFEKPLHFILNKLFLILNTFVETKTILVRKNRYIVPFPINLKRRVYLITKWLVLAVNHNKQKSSFANRFIKEILSTIKNVSSNSLTFKNLNNSRALENRSNVHYRW